MVWCRRKPVSSIVAVDVPRRWWQAKQIRLRCSCGWESPETWPARPPVEIAYSMRITMRALAEVHWGSAEHEIRRQL